MDDPGGEGARYRAFISYSHKDAAVGRRLHRRLESYRMPRRLVGRTGPRGPVPARLAPIFRDREELAAAHDLTAEIRAALAASASLIVVCTPSAAASPWVGREVEVFRELHPGRPILAAVVEGEPGECFPDALRQAAAEPLAADLRPGRDGSNLGLLKLIAGVAGVGLDELVQRDAQRRVRSVTAVTAIALVAALAMGLLTAFALDARSQAERQRAEAEGLVEFMLTDLRTRLKGVGRISIMSAVNQRALAYYADQDLGQLPASSLERRARVLHAMGEDDESRGDHDRAMAEFREARRTTATILAEAPSDPERIYNHAQSEFWIGYVDFNRGRFAAAEPSFLAYKRLADRLVALSPSNPQYLQEAAYADGNLCSIALQPPKRPRVALAACLSAMAHMQAAAGRLSRSQEMLGDLANRHAWLADAYLANDALGPATDHRRIQEKIVDALVARDPANMDLRDMWLTLQAALAKLEMRTGRPAAAKSRLMNAIGVADRMTLFDPSNAIWAERKKMLREQINSAEELIRKR